MVIRWQDEFGDGVGRKIDVNAEPQEAAPAIGPSGNGADARTPEPVLKTVSMNVPMPDNKGPAAGKADGALWPNQGV